MFVSVGGSSGGMEYPGIVFMRRYQIGGLLSKITAYYYPKVNTEWVDKSIQRKFLFATGEFSYFNNREFFRINLKFITKQVL